jgi:hypothetical protein
MRTIRFIINKKSLDAAHQGFPCRHPGEKVEEINE